MGISGGVQTENIFISVSTKLRVEAVKPQDMGSLGRIAWLIKGHTKGLFDQQLI